MNTKVFNRIVFFLQSDYGKKKLIEKISSLESKRLKINPPCQYELYLNYKDGEGYYDPNTDTLYINKKRKILTQHDYREFLDTIIHETRHKYQFDVCDNPEKHQKTKKIIQDYLRYSDEIYPEENDPDYDEKYRKNGLEHDAFPYAEKRTQLYWGVSLEQIFSLNEAPENVVENQILMDAWDVGPDGTIAPISVKKEYFEWLEGTVENEKGGKSYNNKEKKKKNNITQYQEENEYGRMGIMSNRMDFTDRAISQVYFEMSEEVANAFQQLIESMRNLCVAHAYKPMVDFTNALQEKYQTEFKECVMKLYSDWREGEASLESLAKKTYSGEAAEQTARMYMDELETALQDMFKGSYAPIQVDDSTPVLAPEDILKINDEITGFMQKVENAKTNAQQVCNSREEENVLYKIIKPVIVTSGDTLYDWMKENMNQVIQGSELYAQGVALVVGNISSGMTVSSPTSTGWGNADNYM